VVGLALGHDHTVVISALARPPLPQARSLTQALPVVSSSHLPCCTPEKENGRSVRYDSKEEGDKEEGNAEEEEKHVEEEDVFVGTRAEEEEQAFVTSAAAAAEAEEIALARRLFEDRIARDSTLSPAQKEALLAVSLPNDMKEGSGGGREGGGGSGGGVAGKKASICDDSSYARKGLIKHQSTLLVVLRLSVLSPNPEEHALTFLSLLCFPLFISQQQTNKPTYQQCNQTNRSDGRASAGESV